MTTPVIETPMSEPISMTIPVIETPATQGTRIVQFTMPSKYTLETLPLPNNQKVQLKQVEARTLAVLRYTGYTLESRVNQKKEKLLTYLERDEREIL